MSKKAGPGQTPEDRWGSPAVDELERPMRRRLVDELVDFPPERSATSAEFRRWTWPVGHYR